MVSDKVFTTDGTQKIFSSDFDVISEDHIRVFLDGTVVSRDDYDLINNAAVFFTPPTSGQTLTLQVGTTPADILTSPTDAGIVAANITDINNVADALGDIATILANIADINDVADDLNEAISEIETALANAQAAAASATAAAASATAAATSETNASTSETNAANSATASATSASASATSATASASSATDSATSATAAASSATAAATSATNAATSETNAATSASSAATSATNAATSATAAGVSETNAANSASAAATSASNAATSETNAATSASDAAASATAAQAALDSMEGTYLGGQASDPTVDLNGDPLNAGDWYFNTTSNISRIYDGSAWGDVAVSPSSFVSTSGDTMTGTLTAPDFIGDLNGAVRFTAKNDEGSLISKGQVVYIKGISGNTPTVGLADANDSSKMPAFGLVHEDANNNASVEIVTFGSLKDTKTDYSTWALGDTLYVSTTAGALTNSPPTGESSLIQNIGKIQRLHASAGIIKVGGAGRTNAVPNLNDGNVFIGNASNQAEVRALQIADVTNLQTTLDGKALASHTHIISDITNLQTTLDGKEDAGNALAFAIALG